MVENYFVNLRDVFIRFDPLKDFLHGKYKYADIARRARKLISKERRIGDLVDGVGDIKYVIAAQIDLLTEERDVDVQRKIEHLRDIILTVESQSFDPETEHPPDEYYEFRSLFDVNDGRLVFNGDAELIGFEAIEDEYSELDLFKMGLACLDEEFRHLKGSFNYEYFALFALWKIDEALGFAQMRYWFSFVNEDDTPKEPAKIVKGSEHHLWRLASAQDCAIEAMEAISHAEHLHFIGEHTHTIEKKIKDVISERSRKAASKNKYHQEVKIMKSELKEWFLSKHDELKGESNEKIAELGIKIVPLPFRTIRDTIAALKKEMRSAS